MSIKKTLIDMFNTPLIQEKPLSDDYRPLPLAVVMSLTSILDRMEAESDYKKFLMYREAYEIILTYFSRKKIYDPRDIGDYFHDLANLVTKRNFHQ